jgi:hypothetical protein
MKTRRLFSRFVLLGSCLLVIPALLSVSLVVAEAASLTVSWNANTEGDLAGYRIYYGTASRTYGEPVAVDKNATSLQLTGLSPDTIYYAALTAFDLSGNESGLSEEASATTASDALVTYYRDADGDGYGWAADSVQASQPPAGYVSNGSDCNDANPSINPAASETCDGVDNDCNGLVDDGLQLSTYYRDADGDGYGWAADSVRACQPPVGYVGNGSDCNDADPAINPAASETCDGVDNDCNGLVDDGLQLSTYYRDADGDGYGWAADSVQACQPPAGYVSNGSDCNDADPSINPAASETCGDGVDQDCDGADPGCAETHFPKPTLAANYLIALGTLEVDGAAGEPGDEVAVFDPDGVCCGQFGLTQAGSYGPLYVNVDDPGTPGDEGAADGDRLIFKVWDASGAAETTAHLQVSALGGSSYQVDLRAYYHERIPLQAGWNLVSFSTNVCYYTGPEPPAVPMLPGVIYRQVSSINDILASVDNQYEVVRSFDAQGAHTYDPALAEVLNDLRYLAPGYGYWIKATAPCELTLTGGRVSPLGTLELAPGWNLVGYWGQEVAFLGAPPEVAFSGPPAEPVLKEVQSAAEIFPALQGMYSIICGFDLDGAHTYRPSLPVFVNDLRYGGPGYGYWIYMDGQGYLSY